MKHRLQDDHVTTIQAFYEKLKVKRTSANIAPEAWGDENSQATRYFCAYNRAAYDNLRYPPCPDQGCLFFSDSSLT